MKFVSLIVAAVLIIGAILCILMGWHTINKLRYVLQKYFSGENKSQLIEVSVDSPPAPFSQKETLLASTTLPNSNPLPESHPQITSPTSSSKKDYIPSALTLDDIITVVEEQELPDVDKCLSDYIKTIDTFLKDSDKPSGPIPSEKCDKFKDDIINQGYKVIYAIDYSRMKNALETESPLTEVVPLLKNINSKLNQFINLISINGKIYKDITQKYSNVDLCVSGIRMIFLNQYKESVRHIYEIERLINTHSGGYSKELEDFLHSIE